MLPNNPIRIRSGDPNRTSKTDSHERTNVRTDVDTDYGCLSGNGSEHTRVYRGFDTFTTIGEVIEAGQLWQTDKRHEVTRTGERDLIPAHVRAAVWYRDGGLCDNCPQEWAGERHNLERSNFIDFARPKRPATWWCLRCYHRDEHTWEYMPNGYVICPIHSHYDFRGDGGRCRVARHHYKVLKEGQPARWHERDMFTEGDLIAYCAHCNLPGPTAVVL